MLCAVPRKKQPFSSSEIPGSAQHADSLLYLSRTQLPLQQIIFREHASAALGQKFVSLFPGLGYAAGYKVLQRIYK